LIEAVLFDWGGTLTTFHNVDMIDAWRVAAEVLAPDRVRVAPGSTPTLQANGRARQFTSNSFVRNPMP
jgi:hypothetical protein